MTAPERIWVTDTTTPPYIAIIPDQARPWPQDAAYILATPEALAKSPEVQALIADAVKTERGGFDSVLTKIDTLLAANDVSPVFQDGFAAALLTVKAMFVAAIREKGSK